MTLQKERKPKGIVIFAGLLIMGALRDMYLLLNFDWYSFMFQGMSQQTIMTRYIFSWALRVAWLICGIGLLDRRELFRKIAIGLSCFMVVANYWKPPAAAIKNFLQYSHNELLKLVNQLFAAAEFPAVSMDSFVRAAGMILCVVDVLFAVCLIFYFSRPKVKRHFTQM